MPKIDRTTLAKIAPDPQSVKALEDLFKESSDSTGAIVKVTKLATDAQTTANAANLAAGNAQSTADSALLAAGVAQTSADAAQFTADTANSTANDAAEQIDIIESAAGAHAVGFTPSKNVSGINVQDAITSLDSNDGSGFRNVVLNGSFIVNQRKYVSGSATTAANQYTLDRWRVVVSGQSVSFTSTSNGNLVTVPAGGIEQVIEGALIVDTTYVINWLGNASGFVNGIPVTPGSVLSVTPGANCTIKFTGGSLGSVQMEQGRTAHPFEPRPYSVELRLCQRYAFAWTSLGTMGVCASGAGAYAVLFPGRMRIIPSYTSITTSNFSDGVALLMITNPLINQADTAGATIQFIAPGATAGRAAILNDGGMGLFSAEF